MTLLHALQSWRELFFFVLHFRDVPITQPALPSHRWPKAWQKADTYSSKKGRFFTWILNIARNAAIDKTRSKAFKQSKQNLDADNFVDIITSNDNLDRSTDAIGIKKFVTNLGQKCKDVIELLYFKGFTQKEASEELNMPIGTIKTRNRNCIQQLRDMVL